jgi:hypothetical protein
VSCSHEPVLALLASDAITKIRFVIASLLAKVHRQNSGSPESVLSGSCKPQGIRTLNTRIISM